VVGSRSEATAQSKDPLQIIVTCGVARNFCTVLPGVFAIVPRPIICFTIPLVPETQPTRLDRVLAQLRLYEHPLLNFSARSKGEGVEIVIQFKDATVPVHTYYFDLHPRDLDHPQFEWSFQRQLYDALHDYFVEMFIRTPQDRADRRQKEL
jgi:hypothetical protein